MLGHRRRHPLECLVEEAQLVRRADGDAGELYERLLREGIVVRPLAGFGAPSAVRISVGTPDEIDALARALDRVLAPA